MLSREKFTLAAAVAVPTSTPRSTAPRAPGRYRAQRITPPTERLPQDDALRIAIVTPEIGPGAGVAHYWQALALALSARHEVHVFADASNARPLPRVQFHRLPRVRGGWFLAHATFFAAANARFAFERALRHQRFDVVLGIGALTPFADVATVHFVQARELDLERRKLFPREQSSTGLNQLDYALYSRAMGWLGRRFYRSTKSLIVTISNSVKADLALLEGAPLDAMVVVPNGVDTQRFHPRNRERYRSEVRRELGFTADETAVLFVGNSWGRKGLRTAIEAIRGPGEANLRLVVVGEGRAAPFIEGLPEDVARRVVFAGTRTDDVERFYAAADIFLLPTLYEPFGLVILEALASGVPTIASACAGASEWLKDGRDLVLLQDPADGAEARAALRSVVESPGFAERLSRNGRRAATQLEWSGVAERILEAVAARLPVRSHGRTLPDAP